MDNGRSGVHGVVVISHVEVERLLGLKCATILPHKVEGQIVWEWVKNLKLAIRRHVGQVSALHVLKVNIMASVILIFCSLFRRYIMSSLEGVILKDYLRIL